MLLIVIIISSLLSTDALFGQACCTAGTPLLGSLEMTTAPKNVLQFGFTIEHNSLSDVLAGSNKLSNPERERISESALFEVNYGITNRFTITGLFSYIRQKRTITNFNNSENILTASGIGDIAILSKYSLIQFDIFSKQELSVGAGLKMPIGNSSLKSGGILIPADMQPGSGSWDGLVWGYYSKGEVLNPNLTLLGNLSYRFNGSNNRFSISNSGYQFGNELIGSIGFNYQVSSYFDFTLTAKFRNTQNDLFANSSIPNTGGNWIYLNPGISYYFTDKLSSRIDGEFPIYRNVTGTQLTTTFTTSLSLFYSINLFEGSF